PPSPGRASSILARYDFDEPTRRFALPGRLDEISGLAMTADGRLFGHDDERGRVHEIDPGTGEVGKRFDLGSDLARDDFEGIAVVGERFFLVSSAGRLYEFREGADEQNMRYRMTDSGLGRGCEIEGLDYDPVDDALLFACKTADDDGDRIVIRRRSMDPDVGRLPDIHVDRGELDAVDLDRDFEPSALVVLPGGTYLLASATEESLLEVDRQGRVVGGADLRNRFHRQPEGLALGDDGTLYIADEENEEDAWLTAYAPRGGER
ncbi:MAG: SdiA-regulated domain-containing protein, partial [Longimicrobiales bacterium]|nr:SdiA-regulated domain-containing protein [Longimicrobiales bacterium]